MSGPVSKTVSYDYNLDGSLKALHYPSGAVVTYTPDAAGRTVSAVDSGNAINYVTGATYGPHGALTGFISGHNGTFPGISSGTSYNHRLQPMNMSAYSSATSTSPIVFKFNIDYDFHRGAGDNGNVYGITNDKDTTRNQTFTYDVLNRLISAQNAGTDCTQTILGGNKKFWGNTYSYDAWGNLLGKAVSKCSSETLGVSAGPDNRISNAGFAFDAAGNMTSDGHGNSYTFDLENRITIAAGYTYAYDGDGNRIKKANGTTATSGTLYWYMTPGVVAESDLAGTLKSEYVFFSGERVARRDLAAPAGVFYYFSDFLKTASVITDSTGNIVSESDYYPWGGELQFVNNDLNHYKFTGKERDGESGLDYFGARYYSNVMGRFITPDWASKATAVPYAEFADPQSLNLYTYVRNVPTTGMDPDGHCGNTFCQIAAGVAIGVGKFVWNSSPPGMAVNGIRQSIQQMKAGPAANYANAKAQVQAAVTLGAAVTGNPVAQAQVAAGAVNTWNGMSTKDKASVVTQGVLTVGAIAAGGFAGTGSSAGGASSLTASEIESGLAGATLRTTQGEISAPVVNRFIDMLRAGEEAPPIKVDGNIIVDGNHRYAAGVLEGNLPSTTPGTISPSQVPKAKPFQDIKVTPIDYGNR